MITKTPPTNRAVMPVASDAPQRDIWPVTNVISPMYTRTRAKIKLLQCRLLGTTLIIQKCDDFFKLPNMIRNSRLHRWRYAQGLVNPAEIVVRVLCCNRLQILLGFKL